MKANWDVNLTNAIFGTVSPSILRALLDKLTPREQTVIKMRFALEDDKPKTLQEIGELLNISPSRVRQIESKALRSMRFILHSVSLLGNIDRALGPYIYYSTERLQMALDFMKKVNEERGYKGK